MAGDDRPILGITMGDPAGIGPEIAIKTLMNPEAHRLCRPVLIGDLAIVKRTVELLKIPLSFRVLASPKYAEGGKGTIEVVDLKNVEVGLEIGKASKGGGKASIEYIERAVDYALKGEIKAVVTGPINKQAVNLAGSRHIGHTEMIADLCGVKDPMTMFWVRGAKIFFLTRHLPLIEAARAVKRDRIVETTLKVVEVLGQIGVTKPLIAVAALNPHASDEGLMGHEEGREIVPAIEELQGRGIRVVGPVPADAVFHNALEGRYDAVLSLYHDQGHVAAKTVDFYGTVSVTLGLPFIRTSVDHGTAYDIAGKGVANPRSLEEALVAAAKLVKK